MTPVLAQPDAYLDSLEKEWQRKQFKDALDYIEKHDPTKAQAFADKHNLPRNPVYFKSASKVSASKNTSSAEINPQSSTHNESNLGTLDKGKGPAKYNDQTSNINFDNKSSTSNYNKPMSSSSNTNIPSSSNTNVSSSIFKFSLSTPDVRLTSPWLKDSFSIEELQEQREKKWLERNMKDYSYWWGSSIEDVWKALNTLNTWNHGYADSVNEGSVQSYFHAESYYSMLRRQSYQMPMLKKYCEFYKKDLDNANIPYDKIMDTSMKIVYPIYKDFKK